MPEGDGNPYCHGSEALETRLRVFVLDRHIKEAEAGVLDHAIHQLGLIAIGRKEDGSKLDVKPRTQLHALGIYLRSVEKAARLGVPDASDQRTQIVNILPGEALLEWLKDPAKRKQALAVGDAIIEGKALPARRPRKAAQNGKARPPE